MAVLTNPNIRGGDYGDYTCAITDDGTVIGRRVFTINRVEGEWLYNKWWFSFWVHCYIITGTNCKTEIILFN